MRLKNLRKESNYAGWINGGYFVFNKKIFNYLPNKQSMLEREPINRLTNENQLSAFKHYGFWQCMIHQG